MNYPRYEQTEINFRLTKKVHAAVVKAGGALDPWKPYHDGELCKVICDRPLTDKIVEILQSNKIAYQTTVTHSWKPKP
jgi:hypothetical protein